MARTAVWQSPGDIDGVIGIVRTWSRVAGSSMAENHQSVLLCTSSVCSRQFSEVHCADGPEANLDWTASSALYIVQGSEGQATPEEDRSPRASRFSYVQQC